MTELDEVFGDGHGTFEVLGIDRRELRPTHVWVDGDDGLVRHDVDHCRGDEDRAIRERAAQPGHVAAFPALGAVLAGGVHDQVEVGVVERLRRALQQFGAEWLDVGDEDADDVGALATQAPGDQAGLVAEVVDDGTHTAERGGSDAVSAVDDARHGRDRHAGVLGDIADGHPERLLCHVERPPTVVCSTAELFSANDVENVYNPLTLHHRRGRRKSPRHRRQKLKVAAGVPTTGLERRWNR